MAVDTIWGENRYVNKFKNYYHKPNFNFQHLWNINENTSLTNVLYYSTGKGGGTGLHGGMINYTQDNQIDFQNIYDSNHGNIKTSFYFGDLSIDLAYSDSEKKINKYFIFFYK